MTVHIGSVSATAFATSTTQTLSILTQPGDTIHVWGTHDTTNAATITCSDNVNGSYGSALDDWSDATNQQRVFQFVFQGAAGGAATITVTLSHSNAFFAIAAAVVRAPQLLLSTAHSGSLQAAPGTGVNAVKVTIPPTWRNALFVALSMNTGGSTNPANPNSGSNSTLELAAWSATLGNAATIESKWVDVNSLDTTATFTARASDTFITMGAVYGEAYRDYPHTVRIPGSISTTSTSYVELMRLDVVATGNPMLVMFSASAEGNSLVQGVSFQVTLDGVALGGTGLVCTGGTSSHGECAFFVMQIQPSPGLHKFKVNWRTTTGTVTINPSTGVEHAQLIVEEVVNVG